VPAIGLDRDRPIGWDIRSPAGVAPVGGASVIGFRDCRAAGLDIRVVAIPAVTVAIEFGGTGLTVDSAAGRQAFTGFVSAFPRGTMRVRSQRVENILPIRSEADRPIVMVHSRGEPRMTDDDLADFQCNAFTHEGKTRNVFRKGSGPAVIVIAEFPGISPQVFDFARRVAAKGCTAVVPHLYGKPRA
jgi:Dienelactone hydrolase family